MSDTVTAVKKALQDRNSGPRMSRQQFESHFLNFLTTNTFFAEISRSLHRVETTQFPLAAVTFDPKRDLFCLCWNPYAFGRLTSSEAQGIIIHEIFHLAFKHLTMYSCTMINNIAQDLAINSIIQKMELSSQKESRTFTVPKSLMVPGVLGEHIERRPFTIEELKNNPLIEFIARLKPGGSTQQYLMELYRAGIDDGSDPIQIGYLTDDHTFIQGDAGDSSGDLSDYIDGRIQQIVKRATQEANASGNWGNIPADIKGGLIQLLNKSVSWRALLDQFIGYSVRSHKKKTITRINKRYPYIHAGSVSGHRARLLVAIDQSASVHDDMLQEFYTALASLTREIEVDYIPFDCTADVNDVKVWKKGTIPLLERVKQGGTNFSAPTEVVNDPRNAGRWDAMVLLTDGGAAKPIHCKIPRAYVLGKGCKLPFETNDTKIVIDLSKGMLTEY